MKSICNINCNKCNLFDNCKSCKESNGCPFGKNVLD